MLHFCTTRPRLRGWNKRRLNDLTPKEKRIIDGWANAHFYPREIVRANGNKGILIYLEQTTAVLDKSGEPVESHLRERVILIERKSQKAKPVGPMKLTVIKH